MSKWISVKERLPKDHQIVLIYKADDSISLVEYQEELFNTSEYRWREESDLGSNGIVIFKTGFIKYWMPLPESPKETE